MRRRMIRFSCEFVSIFTCVPCLSKHPFILDTDEEGEEEEGGEEEKRKKNTKAIELVDGFPGRHLNDVFMTAESGSGEVAAVKGSQVTFAHVGDSTVPLSPSPKHTLSRGHG